MALKTSSNVIIIEQLKERLCALEDVTGGDVLVLCAPIRSGLDLVVKEAVDGLPHRKRKLSVLLETGGGYIEVTQRIAQTLRHHYRVVDFIIPNCAYSAGTVSRDEWRRHLYGLLLRTGAYRSAVAERRQNGAGPWLP